MKVENPLQGTANFTIRELLDESNQPVNGALT